MKRRKVADGRRTLFGQRAVPGRWRGFALELPGTPPPRRRPRRPGPLPVRPLGDDTYEILAWPQVWDCYLVSKPTDDPWRPKYVHRVYYR